MPLSKHQLEDTLTRQLNLNEAKFELERVGQKWSGNIISSTFSGLKDLKRQQMIWDALDAEFGPESVHLVGTLLAYTPDEWNVDLEAVPTARH
ncbi:MAG: hypothetical protein NTX50_08335 [Candidatus Sumerlaeota bacterium]|nr:hypothetical protein [Candidatus Sumerlaeota bacterium]